MLKGLLPLRHYLIRNTTIMSTPITKRSLSTSPPPPPPPPQSIPSTSTISNELPLLKRAKLDESTTTIPSIPTATTSSSILPSLTTVIPLTSTKPAPKNPNKQTKSNKNNNNNNNKKKVIHKPGGAEETGQFDIIELLGLERFEEMRKLEEIGELIEEGIDGKEGKYVKRNWKKESEIEWGVGAEGKDIEVKVVGISAHGDGLAILTPSGSSQPTRLVSIPFTLPNELVKIHLHRHEPDIYLSHADLLEIIEPSPERLIQNGIEESDKGVEVVVGEELKKVREKYGERVMCKYFGTCSGCQYQPLSYATQLILKQNVVRKAFANFSLLAPSLIPEIGETIPSPKQYAYRTKLTPHFQSPPSNNKSSWKDRKNKSKGKGKEIVGIDGEVEKEREWELTIGFEEKGRKRIVDIEECVIATKVINDELILQREIVKNTISTYKRGSTLLLRDSLPPRPAGQLKPFPPVTSTEPHVCITDHHETVREQVGDIEFEQIAGSFFQNNSSILPSLMNYIREVVHPSNTTTISSDSITPVEDVEKSKTYLIDAYCGSGLFAVGLADQFDQIEGVEIDKNSVKWAKLNAEFNKGQGRGEVGFRAGNAEAIFDTIKFPPSQTTIVIDPPRKGCDPLFLSQLLAFNPSTIIYVSCNVHTQARDIGWIVNESRKAIPGGEGGEVVEGKGFWIESLRAADLFANTHHAEGVAVLRRKI